jgi:hypothetical protein
LDRRSWAVEVSPVVIARIRQFIGVDLSADKITLDRLKRLVRRLATPLNILALLEILFRQQAQTRGISDAEFVEGLTADEDPSPVDRALKAFFEEIIRRVPRRPIRQQLRATLVEHFGR